MMEELFDTSNRKLDELAEEMRVMDQRVGSLEQGARQPRLTMEAGVQADKKTRERTEGAAKAVQVMHVDSCSANRVDPDTMCSTNLGGDSTGPPALPYSGDDALIGKALRRPSRVSHPWRCAHQQPPVAYSSPAKPLQQRRPLSTSCLFGSA